MRSRPLEAKRAKCCAVHKYTRSSHLAVVGMRRKEAQAAGHACSWCGTVAVLGLASERVQTEGKWWRAGPCSWGR